MADLYVKAIGGIWHVKHTDPEVVRLFGTDTIPTPFIVQDATSGSELLGIVRRIAALNPDKVVRYES